MSDQLLLQTRPLPAARSPFADSDDVVEWLESEMDEFSWLLGEEFEEDANLKTFANSVRETYSELFEAATAIREASDDSDPQPLQESFKDAFGRKIIFASDSTTGAYIQRIADRDERVEVPAHVYRILQGDGNPPTSDPRDDARAYAYLYKPSRSAEDTLDALYASQEKQLDDLADRYETRISAFREQTSNVEQELDAMRDAQSEKFHDAQTDQEEEYNVLLSRYTKELPTYSTVKTWGKKVKQHVFNSVMIGVLLLVVVAITGITVIGRSTEYLGLIGAETSTTEIYPGIITLLTIATLGVYAVRMLGRVLIGQIHLASDAQSRVSVARTYLAMTQDDGIDIEDMDRKVMLESLFRPVDSGLGNDDSVVSTTLERIARTFSNRG